MGDQENVRDIGVEGKRKQFEYYKSDRDYHQSSIQHQSVRETSRNRDNSDTSARRYIFE